MSAGKRRTRPAQTPAVTLIRQGVYQGAGGLLLAGALGLVVWALNPAPKKATTAASCSTSPTPSSATLARVYG